MRPPDLVDRDFTASRPDELWVADFTYLRCWEGVVFFSFVIDAFSRRIVGWQFAAHMRTDLVLDALRMALDPPPRPAPTSSSSTTPTPAANPNSTGRRNTGLSVRRTVASETTLPGTKCSPRGCRRGGSPGGRGRSGDSHARGRRRGGPGPVLVSISFGSGRQAAAARCSSRTSAGVRHPSVLRGRLLSASATAARSSALWRARSVPLGKYCRSSPLVFSLVPRCQGLCGSQKYTCRPVSILSWRAGPSRRPGPRSASGAAARAARRARRRSRRGRPRRRAPVTGGPFLTLGRVAAGIGGRCSSIVKRLVRSTSVPIAERSMPEDQVALPVAGDGAVGGLGGPLADHHLVGDEALAARADAGPGDAQRPAGAQARGQLARQRAAALHEQRLVDRLVRDPHRRIIGEVDRSRPEICSGLHAVAHRRSWRRGLLRPFHGLIAGPAHRGPVGPAHLAGEPVLHVLAQPVVGGELGRLRDGAPSARPSTAPPTPGTRACRRGWPRCAAAPARSSTATARSRARSRARPCPRRAATRSPRAPRSTGTGTRPASSMNVAIPPRSRNHRTASRRDTPTACAASSLLKPSRDPPPEPPLDIAPHATACPATSSATGPSTPSSTQQACPSQPPRSRCCDDQLNPPNTPASRLHPGPRRSRACSRRSARSATPTTTRWPRASSTRFKTELIADRVWRTRTQLELAIVEYVAWFNHDRLHERSATSRPPSSRLSTLPGPRLPHSINNKETTKPGLRRSQPPFRAAGGSAAALEAIDLAVELGVGEDRLDHRGPSAVELCPSRRG